VWLVVGSAGALQHIDPASTGRWATIRAFATAVAESRLYPFALSLCSIIMSLNHGLKLLWFTTLESCLVAPTSVSPGSCTPSTFSLPSDRVSIIFIIPIVAHVYLPSMRLSASLVSWLLGCTCIAASYVRIGVFVDTLNLLTAAFVPVILFKFDAAVWSSFTLHEQTVLDAERALSAVERTRVLERTILETDKANVETRSAELRSMMGNVAHDLKTPIQSIAMGVELLRYFFSRLESYACPSMSCLTCFFFPCSSTTGRKCRAMCPLIRAPPNRSVRSSFWTAFGPRANS
jgi:signal transduction histidine kinase